jgi:hypothetical protein
VFPGQTASVSVAGATFRYTASAGNLAPVVILVAGVPVFVANQLDGGFFVDRRTIILAAYDLRAVIAGPEDSAVASLQFPAGEARPLIVSFFDRVTGRQVVIPATGYGVDRGAGVVTLPLDGKTLPRLQELSGTVFTIAVPVLEPAPTTSDLVQASMQLDRRNGPAVALTLRETSTAAVAMLGNAMIVSKADLKTLSSGFLTGAGTREAEGSTSAEKGPLAELPLVPPVLINLPSVTLTPAGSEPSVTPPASSSDEATGASEPPAEVSDEAAAA